MDRWEVRGRSRPFRFYIRLVILDIHEQQEGEVAVGLDVSQGPSYQATST